MSTESTIAWYNENEGRAFPVQEYASRIANNGNTLPDDIIVDVGIMVPPEHSDVFVSTIRITETLISVSFRSTLSGLLIGTFPRNTLRPYAAYPLTPLVDNVTGWVAFGTHRAVTTEDYRFNTYLQSGLEVRAVTVLDALPVRRFLRLAGRDTVYADDVVHLEAGANITIEADVPANKVIVKLTPGTQGIFVGPCKDRATEDICGTPPIRKIAGVCANANGEIKLRFE